MEKQRKRAESLWSLLLEESSMWGLSENCTVKWLPSMVWTECWQFGCELHTVCLTETREWLTGWSRDCRFDSFGGDNNGALVMVGQLQKHSWLCHVNFKKQTQWICSGTSLCCQQLCSWSNFLLPLVCLRVSFESPTASNFVLQVHVMKLMDKFGVATFFKNVLPVAFILRECSPAASSKVVLPVIFFKSQLVLPASAFMYKRVVSNCLPGGILESGCPCAHLSLLCP